MAATSSGRRITEGSKSNGSLHYPSTDNGANATESGNTSVLLTDMLNCDNSEETDEFVNLFTSQPMSSVSTSYDMNYNMSLNQAVFDSQSIPINDRILNQTDIEYLDEQLKNLPKEIYIGKLTDLCSNNESMICWYRDILCTRAKSQSDCPRGNLINRKSTKSSPSTVKYARDCFTLHMFLQGDKLGIETIFDRNKNSSCGTDSSKINLVELRVTMQSLMQRVTELEDTLGSKNKSIENLESNIRSLRSEHVQLRLDYECLKAEATSRFTKYDSFQKLTADNIKRVESDFDECRIHKNKTNDELKRLAKVSLNFQKQLSTLSPNKTYANIVDEQSKTSTISENRCLVEEAESCRTIHHNSQSDSLGNVVAEGIQSLRTYMSNTPTQNHPADEGRAVPALSTETPRCTSPTRGQHNGDGQNDIEITEVNSTRSERHRNAGTQRVQSDNVNRSVNYNGESCMVTLQPKKAKQEEDIFIGVTYNKTARYYLSGINKKSTKYGIENYIQDKGVKTTHLMLFKPRYGSSLVTAKVNVPAQFAKIVESPRFWPEGVRCRRWLNNRDWSKKCALQPTQENWDSEIHCEHDVD